MFRDFNIKPLVAAMAAASLLTACGGGGGGSDPAPSTNNPSQNGGTPDTSGGNPNPNNPGNQPDTSMTMTCADGSDVQCSGSTVLLSDNGVTLTDSGVQVFSRTTSDLADPIVDKTTPIGMALFDRPAGEPQPLADVRVRKDATTGLATGAALLLSNLNMSWDGTTDRPLIIETFATEAGRVELNTAGALARSSLRPTSDVAFYNFASLGRNATQANYANNSYYPRSATSDCTPVSTTPADCETSGISATAGDWSTSETGRLPSWFGGSRLHNDGDIHAGDIPGAVGTGVPFPGSKGYRSLDSWNYQYANLSSWVTQDTIRMAEWTGGSGSDEHNTGRRGVVAFGAVTDPTLVPTSGTATYSGIVYGYYATSASVDPDVVRGTATVTVDYGTRNVTVSFTNVIRYDATGATVPLAFDTAVVQGTGRNANYMTGPINAGTFTGGLSARYFGPIVSTGSTGAGPAEIAGAMRFTSGTGGAAVIGGFIARKD